MLVISQEPSHFRYFTDEQKAIYSIVLQTQKKAIASVKPGQTFMNLQNDAIKSITKGLQKLGILSGNIDQLIANEAYKPFICMV
jgi:Xaa-Pro aminopeptidase